MSRLVIEVSDEQHQQIKALAALGGVSIKEYVLAKIFAENTDSEAMDELKELLAKRIDRADKGHISKKSFADITEATIKRNTL